MTTKQELFKGVLWTGIEKYSGFIVSVLITSILARLLSPEEFGVVAVATVIIQFFSLFTTMGIGPAIIQKKQLEKNDIDSIYTFTILIGLCITVLFFGLSNWIANLYEKEILSNICKYLSVNLFFSAANIVPNALMFKNKRFKNIAQRTLVLQAITGLISIISAFCGLGIYSLLISPIFTSAGIFVWNRFYYPCRIRVSNIIMPVRQIFSYSSYQFLFEAMNYFSRNLDKLLVGKYLNMNELGYYEKSYRLMGMPMNLVTAVINPVLQPVLSEYQDEKQILAQKYKKILSFLACLSFPIGVTMFFCSEEIILIFFGSQWTPAILPFSILTLSLPLQIMISTTGAIYQSSNATKHLFYVGVINTCITIIGFLISIYFFSSIVAVSVAFDICLISSFFISYSVLYNRVLKSSALDILKVLIAPFCISLIVGIILHVENSIMECSILISLIVKCITATSVTIFALHILGIYNIKTLLIKK